MAMGLSRACSKPPVLTALAYGSPHVQVKPYCPGVRDLVQVPVYPVQLGGLGRTASSSKFHGPIFDMVIKALALLIL